MPVPELSALTGMLFQASKDSRDALTYNNRGGVRGIVQLQVLRELEKILGPDLPIQLFFDLIVGSE